MTVIKEKDKEKKYVKGIRYIHGFNEKEGHTW